jgi:chloramphenicol 3-O phosphotransferase
VSTVVVLNGTSSSGKTTLARAFQEVAPSLFLNFSIDSILYALPQSAVARIISGADISDLRFPELVRALYACVRQLLDLGHDLVVDHAVTSRHQAELLVAAVQAHEVLLVGLDCPVEVLARREKERRDRREGMAGQQRSRIHSWLVYDLLIDTSAVSEHDGAARILEALTAGPTGAFERTRTKLGAA